MTFQEVEEEVRKLAQLALLEEWPDQKIREACTISGRKYEYFLPMKYARVRKVMKEIRWNVS